jgi:hypothetical protein
MKNTKKNYKKGKKYTTHELLDYVRFSETKENKNGLIHRTPGKKEKEKCGIWRERDDRVHTDRKKKPTQLFPRGVNSCIIELKKKTKKNNDKRSMCCCCLIGSFIACVLYTRKYIFKKKKGLTHSE